MEFDFDGVLYFSDITNKNAIIKNLNRKKEYIENKLKELIGVNIISEFRFKCDELFSSEMWCDNVRMLLGISVHGVIFNYFPHQIKIGNMIENQWWDFCKEKLPKACIAHSIISNNA